MSLLKIRTQSECSIIIEKWDDVLKFKSEMSQKGYVFTRFDWNPKTGKVVYDYRIYIYEA